MYYSTNMHSFVVLCISEPLCAKTTKSGMKLILCRECYNFIFISLLWIHQVDTVLWRLMATYADIAKYPVMTLIILILMLAKSRCLVHLVPCSASRLVAVLWVELLNVSDIHCHCLIDRTSSSVLSVNIQSDTKIFNNIRLGGINKITNSNL
jgi:hypothetical protein